MAEGKMRSKLLIVDDNDDLREAVIRFLKDQNDFDLDIDQASSGELAIEVAKLNKPDVILMDLRLPKMNGIDAAYRIKEDLPDCEIIMLTMFEVEHFKKIYAKDQIVTIIPKSELYERLIPVLRKCLSRKKPA